MKRATQRSERDRRSEPTVIIMSLKDYVDTVAPSPKWLKEIQAESKRKGLDKLKMSGIDDVIAEVRRETRTVKTAKSSGK
jgi:hypothetical protein